MMIHPFNKPCLLCILLLSCYATLLNAQHGLPLKLRGTVTTTGRQPLPYASIYNTHNRSGTVSNEAGVFEIATDTLPAELNISCIGYQAQKITVTDTAQLLAVILDPAPITLAAVSVGSNEAVRLLQQAFEKAVPHAGKKHYGKGYIRQFTQEGDTYTGLQEAFFNAQWQNFAMTGWQPVQSRYANLKKAMISFTNFSFFSFIATGYLPNNVVRLPVARTPDSLYNCRISQYITGSNGHEIAVITCTPEAGNNTSNIFSGKVYIDTDNYDVLKIDGHILHFAFDLNGPLQLKDTEITTIMHFKKAADGTPVLDFADLTFTGKAAFGFVTAKKLSYVSKILMYDYDDALSQVKYTTITPHTRDAEVMKNTPYNSSMWENNAVISHTPVEKEIIRSFEHRKLISNYLR